MNARQMIQEVVEGEDPQRVVERGLKDELPARMADGSRKSWVEVGREMAKLMKPDELERVWDGADDLKRADRIKLINLIKKYAVKVGVDKREAADAWLRLGGVNLKKL